MIKQPYNRIDDLSYLINYWLYNHNSPPLSIPEKKLKAWETQLDQLLHDLSKPSEKQKKRKKSSSKKHKKQSKPDLKLDDELLSWLGQENGFIDGFEPLRKHLLEQVIATLTKSKQEGWIGSSNAYLEMHNMAKLMHLAGLIKALTPNEKRKITEASRSWQENYPPEYVTKTKEASGSSTGIDAIVEKMRQKPISKKEIQKLACSDNMLSISVQINARLKKLDLKMKKIKRKGDIYYGIK